VKIGLKADKRKNRTCNAVQFVCPQGMTPNRKALKNWTAIFLRKDLMRR
jgi:hypothetical protein